MAELSSPEPVMNLTEDSFYITLEDYDQLCREISARSMVDDLGLVERYMAYLLRNVSEQAEGIRAVKSGLLTDRRTVDTL